MQELRKFIERKTDSPLRNLNYIFPVWFTTESIPQSCFNPIMQEEYGALIDEWPKVSFEEIADEDVGEGAVRVAYKSFFALLRLPETLVISFMTLLKEGS